MLVEEERFARTLDAGVNRFGLFETQTSDELRSLLLTNALSPVLLTRELLPLLRRQEALDGEVADWTEHVNDEQYLSEYVGYNLIILGTITILIIFFAPRGIVGTIQHKYGVELFPVRRS